MSRYRHITALLAIFAVLIVSAASLLPGHSHDNDSARPCDVCHSSHLPCLQPLSHVQLIAQAAVVWQHAPEDFERKLDAASVTRSPRAPPV